MLELYSDAVCRPWNRIFLFDRELYHEFAPKNPDCIFYLPLASDVTSMSSVCDSISPEDVSRQRPAGQQHLFFWSQVLIFHFFPNFCDLKPGGFIGWQRQLDFDSE